MQRVLAGNVHRAIVFNGRGIELDQRRPVPEPDEGEALLRPTRLGISALDVQICRGLHAFTGVLGHEFVGVVEQLHESVTGPARDLLGARVVGSISTRCGACDLCQRGLSTHCRSRSLLGIAGRDGCFADRFTLPAANLVPVPDSIDDDHAVFTQPLAFAAQAARRLTIEGKPYITVLGDGAVALLAAQIMARLNASVRLVAPAGRTEAIGVCEKWGLRARAAEEVGRRADQDIIVLCTGDGEGLDIALGMVRPRGTILLMPAALVAAAGDRRPVDPRIVFNEIEVIGSFCGPVNEAVALLARGEIDVAGLISRRMRLSDGPAAIRAAAQAESIRVTMTVER